MALFVGLDVSLRTISVCIVEAKGKVVWEGKVLCEGPALIAALAPYRKNCFLACKTEGRMKDDSRKQLEESLRLLKTDHVDLYQFHALTKMTDLDRVLGPGGAMETMEAAKKEGKIRYIGFSVHSAETAVAAMDRYNFDTILFPLNFVLYTQAGFGPQILKKAQEKKMGILALKGMAKTVWPENEKKDHPEPKCWYKPAAFPDEASMGLRWTLSHPITAAIPPDATRLVHGRSRELHSPSAAAGWRRRRRSAVGSVC